MENFINQIFSIGMDQGFLPEEVQSLINIVDPQHIYEILNKYGVSMLGILVVIAQSNLQVGFSKEPTVADGNCFLTGLQNQILENWAVRPHLSQEHVIELNMDIKHLRKLWCNTGRGYFAGKWGASKTGRGECLMKNGMLIGTSSLLIESMMAPIWLATCL